MNSSSSSNRPFCPPNRSDDLCLFVSIFLSFFYGFLLFCQATIRTEFRDTTIITIAHRLNTIMDSDLGITDISQTIQSIPDKKFMKKHKFQSQARNNIQLRDNVRASSDQQKNVKSSVSKWRTIANIVVIQQATIFWTGNTVTLSRQCCRVPSSENNKQVRENFLL